MDTASLLHYVASPRLRYVAELIPPATTAPFRLSGDSRNIVYINMPNGEEIRLFMDDLTVRVVTFTMHGVVTSEASFSQAVSAALIAAYVAGYITEGA